MCENVTVTKARASFKLHLKTIHVLNVQMGVRGCGDEAFRRRDSSFEITMQAMYARHRQTDRNAGIVSGVRY
jgi:hypothetical protein